MHGRFAVLVLATLVLAVAPVVPAEPSAESAAIRFAAPADATWMVAEIPLPPDGSLPEDFFAELRGVPWGNTLTMLDLVFVEHGAPIEPYAPPLGRGEMGWGGSIAGPYDRVLVMAAVADPAPGWHVVAGYGDGMTFPVPVESSLLASGTGAILAYHEQRSGGEVTFSRGVEIEKSDDTWRLAVSHEPDEPSWHGTTFRANLGTDPLSTHSTSLRVDERHETREHHILGNPVIESVGPVRDVAEFWMEVHASAITTAEPVSVLVHSVSLPVDFAALGVDWPTSMYWQSTGVAAPCKHLPDGCAP